MISELEGRQVASGARLALTLVALFSSLFLLGAEVAHADPSFALGQSSAGSGDSVAFSISGTDTRANYSVEVDGDRVATGSVPADSAVSGAFTMPDLGNSSETVTVEAEIKQSDETTTQARKLQYLGQRVASTAPAAPQPAQSLAPVQSQSANASQPATSAHKRPHSRPKPAKRPGTPLPQHAPERPAGTQQPLAPRQYDMGAPRLSTSPRRATAPSAGRRSGGAQKHLSPAKNRPPSRGHESAGSDLATFLTAPSVPAIFSLASGVAGGNSSDPPVAASIVLLLLGLTALTLAGPGLVPRRRSRPVRRRAPSRRGPARHPPTPAAGPVARAPSPPQDREAWDALLRKTAASFAPIPLAVLDERATLATRSERKYFLDEPTFERLVGELGSHYLILEIDGGRIFPYDTIYFDTPDLTTYRQHLQERRKRFKCRTRLYPASQLCFFEVKMKGRRGETVKRRLEIGVEQHGILTGPALAFLARELEQNYGTCPPAPLGPTVRTSYHRLTLAGRTSPERLTFDFELMFAADGKEYSIQPGRILLETKTGTGARQSGGQANRVLRRLGVRPVPTCSKYCLGVALAHSDLPDNPFRPLVRHHFEASRHAGAHAYNGSAVAPPAIELGEEPQPGAAWRIRPARSALP